MHHPHYSFRKKISHTADSQDQRHRMVPASRPLLGLHLDTVPDYITPRLIEASPEGQEIYTTFNFPNDKESKVNKAEIKLSRINEKDIDLLFSTVCKQYGQPEQNESVIEGSVKWITEPGLLIFENTSS